MRVEGVRNEILNTEGGADGGEQFSDEVGAIFREQEIKDSKVVYPVRQKGISLDGSCLFLSGDSLGLFSVLAVMKSLKRLPESVFGSELRMSISTNSKGRFNWNNLRLF